MVLYPARQRCSKRAEMNRIFTVCLLGSSPGRVARQIDAHTAEKISAHRAQLATDNIPNAFF
jgi:hypothetical protein